MIHQQIPKFKSSLKTQRATKDGVKPFNQEQLRVDIEPKKFISNLMLIIKEKVVESFWYWLNEILFEKVHFSEEGISQNQVGEYLKSFHLSDNQS